MKFTFKGPLLRFVDFQREIDVEAPTIQASISALIERHPGLGPVLLDSRGQLRNAHRLFLNNQMITKGDLERPIQQSDRLEILTAIAGG